LFRLGIYRLAQYRQESQATGSVRFRDRAAGKRIGFHLFRTRIPATRQEIALFEQAIPEVRLSSGVYRTTYRGRFRALDEAVNSLLVRRFGADTPLKAEDWAASDCLASSEWAGSLFECFPASRLTASDLTLFLVQVSLSGEESYVMEPNGEALQYIRPPFVIRLNPPEPWSLVLNRLIGRRARVKFEELRHSWRLPEAWLDSEDGGKLEQAPYVFRKIPLIHPDAQAMRRTSERFTIRRHSVFEASDAPCHVIRTMNIFNVAYFEQERLQDGVRAIWRSLLPGGMWIVGRTTQESPPVHNASIFVREEAGFRLVERFGAGSEIESLATAERAF